MTAKTKRAGRAATPQGGLRFPRGYQSLRPRRRRANAIQRPAVRPVTRTSAEPYGTGSEPRTGVPRRAMDSPGMESGSGAATNDPMASAPLQGASALIPIPGAERLQRNLERLQAQTQERTLAAVRSAQDHDKPRSTPTLVITMDQSNRGPTFSVEVAGPAPWTIGVTLAKGRTVTARSTDVIARPDGG
jgi:hypothetical protein